MPRVASQTDPSRNSTNGIAEKVNSGQVDPYTARTVELQESFIHTGRRWVVVAEN